MPVRLKFPRGSTMSFLRQFVREGASVDITGATLLGFLKVSPSDLDIDALAGLSVGAVLPGTGIVRVTVNAVDTAQLTLAPEYFWQVRAVLPSGLVVAPESLQGPVMLTPFLEINSPDPMDELTPDALNDLSSLAMPSNVTARTDITTAALHRAVVTAGVTLPWVIFTLESGGLTTWTLRANAGGEVDDTDTLRQPADWNATTNNVIWVRSAIN